MMNSSSLQQKLCLFFSASSKHGVHGVSCAAHVVRENSMCGAHLCAHLKHTLRDQPHPGPGATGRGHGGGGPGAARKALKSGLASESKGWVSPSAKITVGHGHQHWLSWRLLDSDVPTWSSSVRAAGRRPRPAAVLRQAVQSSS